MYMAVIFSSLSVVLFLMTSKENFPWGITLGTFAHMGRAPFQDKHKIINLVYLGEYVTSSQM